MEVIFLVEGILLPLSDSIKSGVARGDVRNRGRQGLNGTSDRSKVPKSV